MQIWILSTEGLLVNKRDFRSWAKFPFLIMSNIPIGFVALTSIRANFVRYGPRVGVSDDLDKNDDLMMPNDAKMMWRLGAIKP